MTCASALHKISFKSKNNTQITKENNIIDMGGV
jgi:hypothetical protein